MRNRWWWVWTVGVVVVGVLALLAVSYIIVQAWQDARYLADQTPAVMHFLTVFCTVAAEPCIPRLPQTRADVERVWLCKQLIAEHQYTTRQTRVCLGDLVQ